MAIVDSVFLKDSCPSNEKEMETEKKIPDPIFFS